MNNLNLDKYLNIVNKEKERRQLTNYIPLYPMLRIENNQLYIGVLLTLDSDDVWSNDEQVKPEYWVLIDPFTDEIISFNKTASKDFVTKDLIPKNITMSNKEISKYIVNKTLQYKNYLYEDIKATELPLQKKLSSILGENMIIDGEQVNINDYLLANLEEDIKEQIDSLVVMLIQSKLGSYTFYYDMLFKQIITTYITNKEISHAKIELCIEIMNNYYVGVIGIDNFFNL